MIQTWKGIYLKNWNTSVENILKDIYYLGWNAFDSQPQMERKPKTMFGLWVYRYHV